MENSKIAAAFIKAKAQFKPALKNAVNPHLRNRYANLEACIEAVDGAFLDNGIVMYQETFDSENGVIVETILLHESGESIRGGKLHIPASKFDAQGFGSALSYARRYSLMATCGIAAEDDDDGQGATPPASKPTKTKFEEVPPPPPPEINRAEIEKVLNEGARNGSAALKKAWAGLTNGQRLAIGSGLQKFKDAAEIMDAEIAGQA